MAEPTTGAMPSVPEVQRRLDDVAQTLRASSSLDTEARRTLAELVHELSTLLSAASVPPAEIAHLAESTAHLAEALQHRHDAGLLGGARDRLESALVRAESHAPFAVGLARRLLTALANIGI